VGHNYSSQSVITSTPYKHARHLFGATGNAGARILKEILARGHRVTAIVRNPAKLSPQPGLTVRKGDLNGCRAARLSGCFLIGVF
jgi:putative NADH-flavin reductase